MLDTRMQSRIGAILPTRLLLCQAMPVITLVIGAGMGWAANPGLARQTELNYAMRSTISLVSHCRALPIADILRRLEIRADKPYAKFDHEDKIMGLAFIAERLNPEKCQFLDAALRLPSVSDSAEI